MAKELSVKIDSEMHGHRIEYILEKKLEISSSLIKRLKRTDGGIILNGTKTTVVTKVSEGDTLVVNIKGRETEKILPSDIPIDIIFEDDDILVVNKSGSMPVHPSGKHKTDTLANAVMHHIGSREVVHIITRLDRETSGVVLVAKNPRAAAVLTKDMKNGKFKKEYVAILNGVPEKDEGRICASIRKEEQKGIKRCVSNDGKEALTVYELVKNTEKLSLVRLFPITGRTHQLRVHMSHIGHPIYGDAMYGATQMGERTRLHCHNIIFPHPTTGEEVSFSAVIPEDFDGIL